MSNNKSFRGNLPPRGPDPMQPYFQQALALHQQGQLADAEAIYAKIVAANPVHFDALHMLGIVAFQMGRLEQGIGFLTKAITINPGIAELHSNLANALVMLRRFDEALAACDKAVKLNPKLADAWNNRAIALQELRRFEDAVASSDRAIRLNPNHAQAFNIRGVALKELGRIDQALIDYDKSLALNTALPHVHYNRANLLHAMNRSEEALAGFDAAIRLKPDFAEAHNGRGAVLLNLGRHHEAQDSCRHAIALKANYADAYNNLGNVFSGLNLLTEARENYAKALSIDPALITAQNNLSNIQRRLGLIDEAIAEHERALALDPENAEANRNLLLTLTYHPTLDLERYFAEHRRFEDRFARRHYANAQPHRNKPDPTRRLRIGYLSSDLRAHTVARSLLPLVRNHAKSEFELYFYAEVAAPDAVSDEFRAHASGWRSTVGLTDEAVAEQIRKDGIDILVCLAGRFDRNRPLICAHKPAPIQISFHDVATSGLGVMDYLISDRILTPRNTPERFTERLLCLPSFYLAEPPADLPSVVQRNDRGIVFGCLNNPAKISSAVLDLWGRAMADVPGSRLLLRYFNAYEAASLRERVHGALARHGIASDRVSYPTSRGSHSESLEQYGDIDIALDTFPFSGSTTTFDALLMGVPVVTLPGKTMVSRWSAAMLTKLSLRDLVAVDADHYVRIVKDLAADGARRDSLRTTLRERLLQSSLTDHARKTRYLERAYRAVWRRWCTAQAKTPDRPSTAINDTKLQQAAHLHQQGRLGEAERLYREIVAEDPRSFDALNLLSIVLAQSGRDAEALETTARAIAINPAVAQTHNTRANALKALQRIDDALASYDMALKLEADFLPALLGRAHLLTNLKRYEEAHSVFTRLVALRPGSAEIRNNQGIALLHLKRLDAALSCFDDALNRKTDYAAAHNNRGSALQQLGRIDEAISAFQHALALNPDYAEAHNNLGTALFDLKRFDEAIASYDRAIALKGDNPEAYTNRGLALMELGRVHDAIDSFEVAIRANPHHAEAIFNRGTAFLLLGDFAQGWRDYEARKTKPEPVANRSLPYPLWLGAEPIAGKTILVHHEQGLGDTIQFCRYVSLLEQAGANVLLAPQPPLKTLMTGLAERLNVAAQIVDLNGAHPKIDVHCPLMSLPLALGTLLETIPSRAPYLSADPARVSRWRERIGAGGLRIGICWQGSDAKIDRGRSFSVAEFAGLSKLAGVRLISLHKGSGEAQLAELPADMKVETLGPEFDNGPDAFLDTAAVIEVCDLVITSDTAIAHLGGALGRPTWVALRHVPDWRWMFGRADYENKSPWYPSLRLYRQSTAGDWPGVFRRIERDIEKMVPPA